MKKLFTLFITGLLAVAITAQVPQKMSYQAVVRNSSGVLVSDQSVGMKISILQDSPDGTLIYQEIYNPNPQTNENGLLSLEIGGGIPLTGNFSTIDWSNGSYYLMTETDPSGGTNYTISGISQLLSVPYALYANSAENYTESDPRVKAISGIVKSDGTAISAAKAGTDYLTPTGSAELLTDFPMLNQNTTGNAATVTTNANLTGDVISKGNASIIANKKTMTATAPVSITGSPTVIASGTVAISIAAATQNTAGSMSAADKTKLDGLVVPVHTIGESYGGGIIFYLDASGQHGLIAATTDQSVGIQWYNGSSTNTTAFASSAGGGDGNTSMIVFNQGAGTYAAKLCYDLSLNSYTDWYLPSKYELKLMYQNIGQGNFFGLGNIGGFATKNYWSSTEGSNLVAWLYSFYYGHQGSSIKTSTYHVRAIRAF